MPKLPNNSKNEDNTNPIDNVNSDIGRETRDLSRKQTAPEQRDERRLPSELGQTLGSNTSLHPDSEQRGNQHKGDAKVIPRTKTITKAQIHAQLESYSIPQEKGNKIKRGWSRQGMRLTNKLSQAMPSPGTSISQERSALIIDDISGEDFGIQLQPLKGTSSGEIVNNEFAGLFTQQITNTGTLINVGQNTEINANANTNISTNNNLDQSEASQKDSNDVKLRYPYTPDPIRLKPLSTVPALPNIDKDVDMQDIGTTLSGFSEDELALINKIDAKLKKIFVCNWFSQITVVGFLMSCVILVGLNVIFFAYNEEFLSEDFEFIHLFFISLVLILVIFILTALGSREVKKKGKFVIIPFFVIYFRILFWKNYSFIDDWFGDDKVQFLSLKLMEFCNDS